jgi:hypothetical protein
MVVCMHEALPQICVLGDVHSAVSVLFPLVKVSVSVALFSRTLPPRCHVWLVSYLGDLSFWAGRISSVERGEDVALGCCRADVGQGRVHV